LENWSEVLSVIENRIFILFFSLCTGIICLFIYIKASHWINSNKLKKRFSRSRLAEKDAEKLLQKKGYAIVDIQKSKPILITIGDKIHRYLIRIDYLVRKKGKVYVVEVKSGEKNPYITNRETRRQMLEYYLAYQPNGIILLNMRNKSISEVKFQFEKTSHQSAWIIKLGYFFAGIIFTLFLYFLLYGGGK
jgi:Holliday junction resolvase